MLLIIKILALILTALVVAKSYLAYRQRQETLIMFLFWSVTWLLIIVIAFYPDILTTVLGERKIGVGSFLGVSLVFVYFVVYRIYVKADRIEKKMQDIIRELALTNLQKDTSRPVRSSKKK